MLCGLVALIVALALPSASRAASLPPGFEETTLLGLSEPTSVDWAPDGRMFVGTGDRKVKMVMPGSTTARDIYSAPGGVHDIAVDADFASNRFLWVFASGDNSRSRLVRVTLTSDFAVAATKVVLGGGNHSGNGCPNPSNTVDCLDARGDHEAGTVISDPDGTLWVSNGDQASPNGFDERAFHALNEQSHAGKVLHVDREGRGLPGHAFCPGDTNLSHVCTKVHSLGHRNVFRFVRRPDGLLVAGDVGWNSKEEVDVLRKGGNYGWPCREGTIATPTYKDKDRCRSEANRPTIAPAFEYTRPSSGASITMGPAYAGGAYPDSFDGKHFVADYVQGWIKLLRIDSEGRAVGGLEDFVTGTGPVVDLQLMPGTGDLVYVDRGRPGSGTAGAVKRIRYAVANRTPVAVATADRTSGGAPLTVRFRGSGSSDPDGETLSYAWDFDGNGSTDSTQPDPTHVYRDSSRSFTARLTVRDPRGLQASQTLTISPGNDPPTATASARPGKFRGGETVQLDGTGTDPNGDALSYSWKIALVHLSHEHPVRGAHDREDVSFEAGDDHDADSHYVATLTVTDARGQSASATVEVRPETAKLTLASSPPGAGLSFGGTELIAPQTRDSTIGYRNAVSAPVGFERDGRRFRFVEWSDRGQRVHEIEVPPGGLTLTARYVDDGPVAPTAAPPLPPQTPAGPPAPAPPQTPAGPPAPPQTPRSGDGRAAAGPLPRVSRARVTLSRRGGVVLRAACPGRASGARCRGSIRLDALVVKRGASGRRTQTVGLARRSFNLAPGRTSRISLRLSGSRARWARRQQTLRVRVTVSAGEGAERTARRVTLRLTAAPSRR